MSHARTPSTLGGLRALGAGASAILLGLGCQVLADVDADRLPSSSATVGATSTTSSGGGQGGSGGAGGQTSSTSGGAGGVGGDGGQGGSGGQGPCTTAADCPSPENPCQLAKCTAGVCGTGNIAAGVPSTVQIPGDCNQSLCNGSGLAFDSPIFNDAFDDGEPCTDDFCANGSPVNAPSAAGQACSHNGGTQCDGAGSCVTCLSSADCPGTGCSVFGACVASCDDGLEDGVETDVDCGGGCGPCPDLAGCVVAADCQSGLCAGNLCLAPTCLDGTKNGAEKGVDCGGGCPGCATGTACSAPSDCQSGVCAGVCLAPQCNDGVANGTETGVDCGGGPGSGCAACPDASPCNVATDCQLGVCTQGHCCGVPHDCAGQCGSLVGSCGVPVDCGGCADPGESCGGGGVSNQCGCTAEPLALTCGGAVCGSATNNCGDLVDCGTCPAPLGCGLGAPGTPGQCGCVAPCGTPLWNATFGGAGNDRGLAVALAPGGELIVAGSFQGTMTLGATTLVSAGSDDVFVARLTSTGVPLWAQRFGDGASQTVSGVAVDNLGNVLLSGDFAGTVNFGGANLTSAGSTDVFVVKLSSGGAHTWSKRAGDVQAQTSAGIAVDGAGNSWLAGSYQGTIGLGGATFATTGADDVFVAKLDTAGNHLFSASYGKGAQVSHQATGVAVAADGSVAISGFAAGSIDFGGGPLNTAGGLDAFVAKLDPAGAVVFGKVWGDALLQRAHGVAFDGAGNVLVTGESEGSVNFGLGALTAQGTADAFVVALGPTGTALWSRLLGGPNVQIGRAIAADGAGNVVIAGEFAGNLDASGTGTQVLVSAGSLDAFVAKLDGAGAAVWSQRFGDVGLERLGGVAASLVGDTTLVGTFQGTIDFGQGPVPGAGGDDVFLMQRGP